MCVTMVQKEKCGVSEREREHAVSPTATNLLGFNMCVEMSACA